jgi:hypothetical protein
MVWNQRIRAVCALRLFVVVSLALGAVSAQTIDQLRQQIRDAVGVARQSAFLAGFIDLSESPQLSSGKLTVPAGADLDIDTWKLPWMDTFAFEGSSVGLRVEAGLGYFIGRSSLDDLWEGTLQGGETSVRTRWQGVSGYLGAGPRFDLGSRCHLTPLLDVSLSYLENHTLYGGAGAGFTSSLLDGILFNWHSTSIATGVALLFEHRTELAEETTLSSMARYDLRYFDGLHSTDPAQDVEDDLQRLTVRTDLAAPTGITVWDGPLRWNTHLAYTRFLGYDQSVLGFLDYFELGLGLDAPVPVADLPVRTMKLTGAILIGEDVRGWSVGFSVAF